jgi:hypothetical protein
LIRPFIQPVAVLVGQLIQAVAPVPRRVLPVALAHLQVAEAEMERVELHKMVV